MRKQTRMFLISHLLGPFLGNTVPLALYIFDPHPQWDIAVLAASITGFWIFPFVLKAHGHYNRLALISVQNLLFCILWSCYWYGGVTSPTLPWVLTIPLLAFFYIGETPQLRAPMLGMFAVNMVVFGLSMYLLPAPGHGIPTAELQGLGIISTTAAALYVAMMAIYYARALASQAELEAVMRHHITTARNLRQAAFEAERANRAKSEFLAKMSHELRTPLNAVIGYSQILIEDAEDSGQVDDVVDLERIHAAGQHLLRLVNNVLDLSKIEAGHMQLYCQEFNLGEMIADAVREVTPAAGANGNTLDVSIAPDLQIILGDELKLRNAVTNLLQNAAKFTSNGRISVLARRLTGAAEDLIEIRVQDTGIGMEKAEIAVLFEKFAVVNDHSSTKYGGTGVGLALTRQLCRLMNGDVTVTSEPGVGSCFTIVVPANVSAALQPVNELQRTLAIARAMDPLVEADRAAGSGAEKEPKWA
ncbi:HAMP domain-containing sensor histidine kinase [Rhizobium sp. RU20A]|uniref:sensor histidine kinase n=1 Tax=Rhizobium sp. RU20A TaxID=1907412 RepID=UPI00165F3ADA|nr:HAMP domain-containing sensor histidine kinase [Rhizobium sp. RU20A]